jgi:hypothetical protein
VFKLIGFGALSNGSTAKPTPLPGRWLISEITRESESYTSNFTLVQPRKAKREPATQMIADEEELGHRGGALTDIDGEMSPKDIIDQIVLPLARLHKMVTGRNAEMVEQANARHGHTVSGNVSDHEGPPNIRWAADMSNGSSPTPQMDGLAKELARKFDIKWSGSGLVNASYKSYRFQLIYRTYEGGNHFNHVHFGVSTTNPMNLEELNAHYGWGYSDQTGGGG